LKIAEPFEAARMSKFIKGCEIIECSLIFTYYAKNKIAFISVLYIDGGLWLEMIKEITQLKATELINFNKILYSNSLSLESRNRLIVKVFK
jgi:hypothetical protein